MIRFRTLDRLNCCIIPSCVLPLQGVAHRLSHRCFYIVCCPCQCCCPLHHNVISPSTFSFFQFGSVNCQCVLQMFYLLSFIRTMCPVRPHFAFCDVSKYICGLPKSFSKLLCFRFYVLICHLAFSLQYLLAYFEFLC